MGRMGGNGGRGIGERRGWRGPECVGGIRRVALAVIADEQLRSLAYRPVDSRPELVCVLRLRGRVHKVESTSLLQICVRKWIQLDEGLADWADVTLRNDTIWIKTRLVLNLITDI